MNREQFDKKLQCILGICHHRVQSPSCPYTRIIDAKDPAQKQEELVMKLLNQFIKANSRKTIAKKQTIKRTKM